jgi:hypothetical protein
MTTPLRRLRSWPVQSLGFSLRGLRTTRSCTTGDRCCAEAALPLTSAKVRSGGSLTITGRLSDDNPALADIDVAYPESGDSPRESRRREHEDDGVVAEGRTDGLLADGDQQCRKPIVGSNG